MALGTENSRRFFGGGHSCIKSLHGIIENLCIFYLKQFGTLSWSTRYPIEELVKK
jgi:hypothetical protein